MMKKIYFMLMGILLIVSILMSGCAVKIGSSCETDSDCAPIEKTECVDDEVISPSAFCVGGACICICGYRDQEGRFREEFCE